MKKPETLNPTPTKRKATGPCKGSLRCGELWLRDREFLQGSLPGQTNKGTLFGERFEGLGFRVFSV